MNLSFSAPVSALILESPHQVSADGGNPGDQLHGLGEVSHPRLAKDEAEDEAEDE